MSNGMARTAPPDRSVASVSLPGSKSVTNRALLLAALADGPASYARRCAAGTPI